MTDAPYERYKDALRRGHVAALRGRLEVAVDAYREASSIAPDRALPYVGLGGALVTLGRADDALAAYGAALDRAPADEGALRGRADVLTALGRRSEAAETLDRLAVVLEGAGRLADACDAARRALELAESRFRRRQVEALVSRLRAAPADAASVEALDRAIAVLDGSGPASPRPTTVAAGPDEADGDAPAPIAPAPERLRIDPAALTLAVELAIEAGDLTEARRQALLAAGAHRAVGQYHAAMDVCYQALAIEPADPDVHLALAELYLDRGWRGPASEKLLLLGRLSILTGDGATRARLCYLAASRFPDDARLAAICA